MKNQIRRENSAYLSHLKALDKGVEERRGKAEAMLENALRWVCMFIQGEETKANAAGGFLYIKARLFLVLSSRVGRGVVLAGTAG
jgi:hypothetical protein